MENKSACQLSRCWELFSPSLSQTLAKLHDAVSALTRFLEFKPDHMLDAYWIDKHARQLSRRFKLFWPPLRPTLLRPHDGVSLSSSFSEFKFDHKFGCLFDQQACMQTFEKFQNIFTPFKPNLSKTAQRSFTLRDKCAHIFLWDFELFWSLFNVGQTKF